MKIINNNTQIFKIDMLFRILIYNIYYILMLIYDKHILTLS